MRSIRVGSIDLLARHVKGRHDLYDDESKITDDLRLWGLAAGSWNAPAYANYLAGVRPWAVPGPTAVALLEDYIASCLAYLG